VSNETRESNAVFTNPSSPQGQAAPGSQNDSVAHVPGMNQGFQTVNVMKEDFGFETPVDLVPLPSQGLIYPPESGFHGKEAVEVRAMTAKEEDILTSRALIKKGTVITELIKSCLVDKSLDVEVLTSGDRNAIMTALRVTGYGSDYSVDVSCPACGANQKKEFSLAELPIKRLEASPVAPGANLFSFDLPVSKKTVHFKFLTGKDERDMNLIQERQKKQGSKVESLVTTRLLHSICSVDGVTDKNKIGTFIRNMPARDSLVLRKHIDKNEPGIEMKAWMTCDECDEHSEVNLPLGASFFWPDTE
tara:strand:- start:383 stop:1294 length:912 start_codon:yes stop_codon:yes gene_type:complete